MNACIELGIIVLLAIILLARPKILCNCSKSTLGRVIFMMIILFLGYHNIVYGMIGVILYIILNNEDKEDVIVIEVEHDNDEDCIVGTPKDTPLLKENQSVKFPDDLIDTNAIKEEDNFEIIINEEIMRPSDSKNILFDLNLKKMGGEVMPSNN